MKKVIISSLITIMISVSVFGQWTEVDEFYYNDISIVSGHNPVSGTAYMLDDFMVIYKTSNNGASWTQQNDSYSGQPLNTLYFIDASKGFAVGSFGTILKTVNGGTTWTETQTANAEDLYNVYFQNTTTGFLCGDEMLKSTDGGSTWNEVNVFNNYQMSSIFDILYIVS